jgi:cadmium resistance protein CadD (predicted permease)
MTAGVVAEAAGLFAVTNVDDLVVLALFFGQGAGEHGAARRVVIGQYLAFTAVLAAALSISFGASQLPKDAIAYLGLIPLTIGVWDGWKLWRDRHRGESSDEAQPAQSGPGIRKVVTTTVGNGGDNIGVYVPVFTAVGTSASIVYAVVFLILVGVWCAAGRYFATHPLIAKALDRWGHIILPVVLITIGLIILIQGGAFGL